VEHPGSVTRAVNAVVRGEAPGDAAVQRIYDELRAMAARRLAREAGATLQPTDLVHEAFLKLFAPGREWENRRHFFGSASNAMRQVLIDHKRKLRPAPDAGLDARADSRPPPFREIEPGELWAAIERLALDWPQAAEIALLRFFGGLSVERAADVLDAPHRTARRRWAFARAWLFRELGGGPDHPDPGAAQDESEGPPRSGGPPGEPSEEDRP
jgi:RNA polymerase sigma factor (TIGR02999 family)